MTALDERPMVASRRSVADAQDRQGPEPNPASPQQRLLAPGSAARFVVIGAVPSSGASTVAFAIAVASRSYGYDVDLLDAASPRRSQLRTVCPTVGVALDISSDTRLVPAYGNGVQVRFIDSLDPNRRADAPSSWDTAPAPASAGIQVVDIGISAEEVLDGARDAAVWLTGPRAQSSTVVLVVPTAAMSGHRCEAVLTQWAGAGFTGIDQIVAVGATQPITNPLCPLLGEAFSAGHHMTWSEQFQHHGIGDFDTADSRVECLTVTGRQLTGTALGIPDESTTTRGRWWRHNKNEKY